MDCTQCGGPIETRHHQSEGSAEAHPKEQDCTDACHLLCSDCDRGLCSGEC